VPSSAAVAGSTAVPETSAAEVGDTTVTPVRQCLQMHVASIDPGARPVGNEYRVSTRVGVQDETGYPVQGATVLVDATMPNGTVISGIIRTHSDGSGGFWFLSAQTGTYTFCVRTVRKPGWVYDPGQNAETCDSVIVP
jgi:hypothetical protein